VTGDYLNPPNCNSPHRTVLLAQIIIIIIIITIMIIEPRGSVVVEALCYKPEGCGFETR
jgi:hypothetical protein